MTNSAIQFMVVLALISTVFVASILLNSPEVPNKGATYALKIRERETTNETFDESDCFVENSFEARRRWLDDEGYVMLHHVRRAGGTTLCGILTEEDDPIRERNCNLLPPRNDSKAKKKMFRGKGRFGLSYVKSLQQLEEIMGTSRVVAVEGFELPKWFLDDPHRSERWTIVTSIRSPVDRFVSEKRLHTCGKDVESCWNRTTSTPGYPLNNVMTRMFAGGDMGDPNTAVTERDYERAVKNLKTQYQIIAITEWIPEMTPIFKYWLGIEGANGSMRRGHGGKHTKKEQALGRQQATMHYVPSSSAQEFLKDGGYPRSYDDLLQEHAYDLRLFRYFQARERWRAINCFLFRSENLPL